MPYHAASSLSLILNNIAHAHIHWKCEAGKSSVNIKLGWPDPWMMGKLITY